MLKSAKMVALLGVAVFCLLVTVATFAFTLPSARPPAYAAPAAQATPVVTKTDSPPPKTEAKPDKPAPDQTKDAPANDPYLAEFNKLFAAKLGVSEDALTAAFSSAFSDTIDQMVKDGKLSADQAAKIKTIASKGPAGILPLPGVKAGGVNGSAVENPKELIQGALPDVSRLFNLTQADLDAKMQSGQSLADIAAAAKVEVQKVKDTLLASFKTQLDALVKAGKVTQTDADNITKKLTPFVDDFIAAKPGVKVGGGVYEKLLGDTTWQALAQLLNMPVSTLKDQADGKQTILAIAQSKNIDEATVRSTVETSLKAQLTDLITKGEVSKEAGDRLLTELPRLVSKFIGAPPPDEK